MGLLDHDRQLLERYVRERCEASFADLVRRHIDLVWGAAFRVTGDAELARDVAQDVFNDFARKARFFPGAASIPGWLYRAAVMAARNAVRSNLRRLRREREVMNDLPQDQPGDATEPAIEQLMPILDQGLQDLPEKDREAVVLRFFARKSLAEIGCALSVSEDAAQKRVSRALDRLKGYFERRGHATSSGVVLAALTTAGAAAAPTGIATTIAGASCAAAGATCWTGSVASFLSGAGDQIVVMKTKIIVATIATVAVTAPLVVQHRTLASLRADHSAMIAAARDLDELRAENAALAAQRQLSAEWAQHQRDREELERLREEANRLRTVAAANPELQHELAETRKRYEATRASAKLASDTIQAEDLKVRTVEAMKHLGLAARIYATDNGERFPETFDDMKTELGEKLSGDLPLENFEFMPHEREIFETEPGLILFREKEPRLLPNGKWIRSYTMADGSVQNPESDTPNFSEWEKDHVGRKKETAAR